MAMRATIEADQDGIITNATGDLEALLGYTPLELAGHDIDIIMPRRYRERHRKSLDVYVATGKKRAMGSWVAVEAQHKDGTDVPVLLVVTERDGVLAGILEERL